MTDISPSTPTTTAIHGATFPYDLVAIDLDGTLFTSAKVITDNTIQTLRKLHYEHGVKVVLASGRMTEKMVSLYTDILEMHDDVYLVGCNGAKCFNITSPANVSQVFHNPLPPTLYSQLFDYCVTQNLLLTIYYEGKCLAVINEETQKHFYDTLQLFAKITSNHTWEYLNCFDSLLVDGFQFDNSLIICDSEEHADEILKDLKSLFPKELVHLVKTECATHEHHQHYVEILHPMANKGVALKTLCEMINVDPQKVLVFGDGENDLEMFSFAGHGICMANGCANLKNAAQQVSQYTNNEEGVHKELENLLMQSSVRTQ